MEQNGPTPFEKKQQSTGRAKSCNASGPHLRLRGERKPFNNNEAVKSLDLALCGLKKGRIGVDYSTCSVRTSPTRRGMTMTDMFLDTKSVGSTYTQNMDNASLMSMNFSHYELMRNLSRSNCNSEAAFSDSTSTYVNPTDMSVKDEHLERYFRSVEMWSRRFKDGTSSIRFGPPEK